MRFIKDLKMYRLMIKTHNVTKLKYLCITRKEKWEEYKGSGSYWKKHLEKHGDSISTELLYENSDYDIFLEQCLYYSTYYDVALSEEFANLIPEAGYNMDERNNLILWWDYATDDMKRNAAKKMSINIKLNHWTKGKNVDEIKQKMIAHHWTKGKNVDEIKQKMSVQGKLYWSKLTLDQRRYAMCKLWEGRDRFNNNKDTEEFRRHRHNKSESRKKYFLNRDVSWWKQFSNIMSKQRLNMTPEAADIRKKKIQEVYKTGKHDKLFERYSLERKGINNPAAKKILWFGKLYTKMVFESEFGEVDSIDIQKKFNDNEDCKLLYNNTPKIYDVIICPYCNKSSNGKKPSCFKRNQLENCKMKNKNKNKNEKEK